MQPRHLLPLGIVTLIWGTTWYVIKTQIGVVPVEWSVVYRFALAATIMFGAAVITRRRLRYPLRAHLFFLALGLFQFAGNFNFVYQASRWVTSGLISVAFALLIIPNAVLAGLVFGHRESSRFWVGAGLGIVGVTMLFRQELLALQGSPDLLFGIGATVLAVLCASVANVMQAAPSAKSYSMIGMLSWAMLYGALIDAAIAFGVRGAPIVETTPLYAGGVFYLAFAASVVAFILYFRVIREIGPAKAAYSGVLVPFVAMALSTLLEGYRWTPIAATGAVLTVSGLFVALSARS